MFFGIAGVTLALLNFRTGFSSDLHFQKFPLHHGKLLLLQVCTKKFKEFCLGVFCSILFFFGLCGRGAGEEGLRAGGMPWLCPVSFQALPQVIKGMKGKDRRAGCWPGLRVCPAIIPSGKEGWFYWGSYFRVRSFPLGLWWRQLCGSFFVFHRSAGMGKARPVPQHLLQQLQGSANPPGWNWDGVLPCKLMPWEMMVLLHLAASCLGAIPLCLETQQPILQS